MLDLDQRMHDAGEMHEEPSSSLRFPGFAAAAADQLPAQQRGSGFGLLAAVNGLGDFVASIWVSLVWTISSASLAFVGAAALALVDAFLAARLPSPPDAGKIGEPLIAP